MSFQTKGFTLMLQVAQSQRKEDQHLVPAAQFNVGKAYYQGACIMYMCVHCIKKCCIVNEKWYIRHGVLR